jgi:hypothetical protein
MFKYLHLWNAVFVLILVISKSVETKSVKKTGKCNKGASWELWLSPNSNMISVDFAGLKSTHTSQNWRVIIQNNKKTVFNQTVSEEDDDNDEDDEDDEDDEGDKDEEDEEDEEDDEDGMKKIFRINAKILNEKGRDNLIFRAVSSKTKETCRATHVYTS